MPTRPDLQRRRRARQEYLAKIKESNPCLDCGVFYPHYVMDFDHVRGDKVDDLSGMVIRTFSMKVIDEEIRKCEIVCSNCHRVRTHLRRQEAKNGNNADTLCSVIAQKVPPSGDHGISSTVRGESKRRRSGAGLQ